MNYKVFNLITLDQNKQLSTNQCGLMHQICVTILLLMTVISTSIGNIQRPNATVERFATGSGFHRLVTTNLKLSCDNTCCNIVKCDVVLIEHIGNGMFVDVYEVKQMKKFKGIFTDGVISVETPAHKSSEHDILFFSDLKCVGTELQVNYSIPMHLRYHKANDGGLDVYVKLENPALYVRCSDSPTSLPYKSVEAPCDSTKSSMCFWNVVDYITDKHAIVFIIPTGNTLHIWLVFTLTILITVGGCVYLTYKVVNKKQGKIKFN